MEATNDIKEIKPDQNKSGVYSRNRRFAIIGLIVTILAWCAMPIVDWLALILTVCGIVFSAIGCRIPPGARRNIAITSLIAGCALLLAMLTIWICLTIFV